MANAETNQLKVDKYDYDLVAMSKYAIELFIEFYYETAPFKTIKFLIDQYELVSEFDSAAVENEVIKYDKLCSIQLHLIK